MCIRDRAYTEYVRQDTTSKSDISNFYRRKWCICWCRKIITRANWWRLIHRRESWFSIWLLYRSTRESCRLARNSKRQAVCLAADFRTITSGLGKRLYKNLKKQKREQSEPIQCPVFAKRSYQENQRRRVGSFRAWRGCSDVVIWRKSDRRRTGSYDMGWKSIFHC